MLLVGIVFFNVDLLRMNREIALTAEKSTALKRDNARLRQEAALLGSSERIQEAAAELGLVLPGAGDVRYLKAHPAFDARKAARSIVEPNEVAALPAHRDHDRAGAHGARRPPTTTTATPDDHAGSPTAAADPATTAATPAAATAATRHDRVAPAATTTTTTTVPPG